ncbi:hypothetical protein [Arthrobacter celericrescens]|uniref:hypothetical protein n=1 Tax=Arthrobacter TaxID=1663 RepID=UPI0013C531DA|nr:hypothetical protein [Arthrobacter celericrescens]
MEILVAFIVIIVLLAIAATISAVLRDGRGHIPPVRSERDWRALDLPSSAYWTMRLL